jgi:ribosome maturation factor RimP
MDKVNERLLELANEVALGRGVEVYDLELLGRGRRMLLRVTIDREEGVTIDDCADFSRDFGAMLDVDDPISGRYTLEVSSPGLDRLLKGRADFERCRGELVNVFAKEVARAGGSFTGRVMDVHEDGVEFIVDGDSVVISYSDIVKARLEI